jgi:hypothetical protein
VQAYGRLIASLLQAQPICRLIAGLWKAYFRLTARLLQAYCKLIAGLLQIHCRLIAGISQAYSRLTTGFVGGFLQGKQLTGDSILASHPFP